MILESQSHKIDEQSLEIKSQSNRINDQSEEIKLLNQEMKTIIDENNEIKNVVLQMNGTLSMLLDYCKIF